LQKAGMVIIAELCRSYPELVANKESWADEAKRKAIGEITILLKGAMDARGKVMLKLNVPAPSLEKVLALLPSMKSPTVNELAHGSGYAVETIVAKREINLLIPQLKDAGASDLIELPVTKIVP